MSTTKEVKALLEELRHQLDPELVPYLEPTLRKILDAAKPKTITEVEYRSDPNDRAEIESLRATIASKDEAIQKLHNSLADQPPPPKVIHPPPSPDHLTRQQRLDEWDKRGKAWIDWSRQCMVLMADNEADLKQRKQLLSMIVGTLSFGVCNYLSLMEGLRDRLERTELPGLKTIVDHSAVEWLTELEDDIHSATGVNVNLELFLVGQKPLFKALAQPEIALPWLRMNRSKKR